VTNPVRQSTLLAGVALALLGCASQERPRPWAGRVGAELSPLGYRNWVVIADAAFPVHSRRGVRTVVVDAGIPEVLDETLQVLERVQNVTPRVYVARELSYVPNDRAPGVDPLRRRLEAALRGYPARAMEYRSMSLLLEDASNKFAVVVFKTKTTLPYSSVYIELDSGYWDAESERELRDRMEARRRMEST